MKSLNGGKSILGGARGKGDRFDSATLGEGLATKTDGPRMKRAKRSGKTTVGISILQLDHEDVLNETRIRWLSREKGDCVPPHT